MTHAIEEEGILPNWATVSLREELINEIRKILKTGRYRSISEFIAEAIRLRLEEISRSQLGLAVREESSAITVAPEIARARGYINTMLDHSEQIWWVLDRLFKDLVKKNVTIHADVIRDLRNCRTLINFIRNHVCPDCDIEIANERVPDLKHSLEKVKHSLIAVALSVGDDYAKDWRDTIDKAERGELRHITPSVPSVPKFVSGLSKDPEKGWTRITLSKPVDKERVEDISKQLGVATEFEDELRIAIKGERKQVTKAAKMIYQLQPENCEMNRASGVLVLGGGIAGIQAALDAADQGVNVYLVERQPSIGGHMAMLDKTFPTLDCSACILTPKMVEAARHPNIKLLTYSEVKEVKKNGNSFEVKILKKPRFVDETKCKGCGTCAQHCPVEVPNEFDMGLGFRKAIYVPFPQAVPLKYTVDEKHCLNRTFNGFCGLCERVCQAGAVNFDQQPEIISLTVGAIIIATGYKLFDARKKSEYGYGRYQNVITNLELERLLNASGPTGGHIMRLSDGRIPKKVAFIQCVGSRDCHAGNPWCSEVCCMCSIKNGILLKEHVHDVEVTIFYLDIRAFGKGFEEFYQRAKDEFGIHFIRGRVAKIIEIPKTENLIIRAENTETSEVVEKEFDMVILSVGIEPSSGISELSKILNVPIDDHGFLRENNIKMNPIATKTEGIFVAGAAQGAKDIPDSVADASAAAIKAVSFLRGNNDWKKKSHELECISVVAA